MRASIQLVPFLFLMFLLLTGCDGDWQSKLTNTAFPYGNQRTAGSGVEYVRAKLLPEKGLNLVNRLWQPRVLQDPAADLDRLFRDKMVK